MEGQFQVALEGGSPWGFTLQGGVDFRSPLRVGKVTGGGRAANGGLTVGDYILAINEQPTDNLKHLEAQQIIKRASGSLMLMCTKIRPTVTSPTPTKSISFTFSPSPLSYTTSPMTNGPRAPRTPQSPKTPSVTVAKPPPPSVKWTPTQLHNGHQNGDQNGDQNAVTEPNSDSLPANVQVFDVKLHSIQHFVIEPTAQQEDGVHSTPERNGDLSNEGVQGDGVEVDMDEWEVVEGPPPQEEVEQLIKDEEQRRRERDEEQRRREREKREREEREERERKEREMEEQQRREREREKEEQQRREREREREQQRKERERREREEKNVVVPATKNQGWYKQMFQSFQTTVEELYPGATTTETTDSDSPPRQSGERDDTYCYDHRGLRVRRGSASNAEMETSVQRLQVEETRMRPRSATISASITTTEDVVSASKKPTSYKTSRYTTGESRNYWKKKDEEHIEWDKKRRSSQDPPSPLVNQRSPDHYTTKMMHPLLTEQQEVDSPQHQQEDKAAKQSELFTRIDPTKLHGALDNAVKLGTLEQEGVPSAMLTQVAQTLEEEKKTAKTKQLLPPPGPKAKAIYNFDAQNEKELSFKKGDILDLTHTVDDNWLEGTLDGRSGIFPKTYIKVLTREQARQMSAPKDEKHARALYDFEGQAKKELSFNRGDTITVTRKIDANWYEGYLGDQKGIFPITYVQLLEEGTQ